MATVVLQYAGAAIGTALGGPIGGIIGRAVGAVAGNVIDQKLFGKTQRRTGPRLSDLRVMSSEEGAAIPVVLGRMRIAGQVIWATNLEEVAVTTTQNASGKGGPKSKSTEYQYFANFAVGLCEGEITDIGRVWADGTEIDLSQFTARIYKGTSSQAPDSLITAVEGVAPAYRDLAYIVFERMPLAEFGNRIPQLSFEVKRATNAAADMIRALTIIPGATEFGYDTEIVTRSPLAGVTETENAHASSELTDSEVSLSQAKSQCKNLAAASLVVTWFGNDLRCGSCTIKPGVEVGVKETSPYLWSVNGVNRASAHQVSSVDGKPAFGGTPSDASVVRAIAEMKAKGLAVMFYPFIMMDVPVGNALPDPYGGAAQSVYPWRGRITSSIAPGRVGTPDKTAVAATEIASFVGTALPSHFAVSGTSVSYIGPAEWSYRRMILHYAKLCVAAGGVDAFLIGSELRGLTSLRSAASVFPFVAALQALLAEVKAILPLAKVSYAADWSEYFGYQPGDGSGDVYFHLDPLWAQADFIGIDNYMPLSDWRDGRQHTDYLAGARSINDLDYLKSNIAGGEGYDWYYASDADRLAQVRTPIADGAYGKPWVYRPKDIKNWWLNAHRNRPGGVELAATTAWVPQSKPIWFTELGCPAIDKGTNQPNVFFDAKSSESALPHFSNGARDDQIQDSYIRAMTSYWSADSAGMVDTSRMFYWCWDARPYPAFPNLRDVWADGANYARGHWLNGRIDAVDLRDLITFIASRFGLSEIDVSDVEGRVTGFLLDRPMSGRDALENLLDLFAIDCVESEGVLKFSSRKRAAVIDVDDIVERENEPLMVTSRAQETDLPRAVRIGFVDDRGDYGNAAVTAQQTGSDSRREIGLSLPAVIPAGEAQTRAEMVLAESWQQREAFQFELPLSALRLEAGDILSVNGALQHITRVVDGATRKIETVAFDFANYERAVPPDVSAGSSSAVLFGQPFAVVMDLATTRGGIGPWVAASASPWPGEVAVLRDAASGLSLQRTLTAPATMGVTATAFPVGLMDRVDHTAQLDVTLSNGALSSVTKAALLDGANIAAVGDTSGFEIIQFRDAEILGENKYRLRGLLRAQAGSRAEMTSRLAGQNFVLLNQAVLPIAVSLQDALTSQSYKIGPARFDAAHPTYVATTIDSSARSLRPLPPAQLRCKRTSTGLQLSWIRQARDNADSWELIEIQLDEVAERYAVEIRNGASVVRSFETTSSQFDYSTAEIIADFGNFPSSLTLRVAQISAATGAGTFNSRTFNV